VANGSRAVQKKQLGLSHLQQLLTARSHRPCYTLLLIIVDFISLVVHIPSKITTFALASLAC
jgi:hypothetical protein